MGLLVANNSAPGIMVEQGCPWERLVEMKLRVRDDLRAWWVRRCEFGQHEGEREGQAGVGLVVLVGARAYIHHQRTDSSQTHDKAKS